MSDLLSEYEVVLLDLDGTVYHGKTVIDGVPEAVRRFKEQVAVRFVTNNASKTPAQVAEHLRSLGVAAEENEVRTSAQAGVRLLSARVESGAAVLVVGTDALADQVALAGFRPTRTAAGVAAVIQGHSSETGWALLAEAAIAIRHGALWIACNKDATLPSERGLLPGNGAMVAALEVATGAEPIIAGKPEPALLNLAAVTEHSDEPRHALVIGDLLGTDIAGAVAAKMDSVVVLTGVTTARALLNAENSQRPQYVARDLTELAEPAERLRIGPQSGWKITVMDDQLTVSGDGTSDARGLLRALCSKAWKSGVNSVQGIDEYARAALKELDLT